MEYKNVTIAPGTKRDPQPEPPRNGNAGGQPAGSPSTLHFREENLSGPDRNYATLPRNGSKYRYIKTIGRGGMKMVLEVHDNDTMRNVAMALLPDISTRSEQEQGQFLREARITASLEHPNIVPVHDIGVDSSGSPYFTMKLLRGRTLATALKKLREHDPEYEKQFPFDILIRFFLRICNAIAFAHSQGVLHLDLKPENVQIGDYGEVLVLDWGLARKVEPKKEDPVPSDPGKTQRTHRMKRLDPKLSQEQINGTPGYMAPEQITGTWKNCTEQTDVYSLGAILYAIITRENPIQVKEVEQMLRDTLAGNIIRPSLRVKDSEIPYGIEAVAMKAMSLDPRDRYPTVTDLRNDVLHFMDGFATQAEKASLFKRSVLFMRRHLRSVITALVFVLLLLLLGFFSWREAHRIISLWIPVMNADFTRPGYPIDLCSFRKQDLQPQDRLWNRLEHQGLQPPANQWLLCSDPFQENIRIDLTFRLPKKGSFKGLELALIPTVQSGELSLRSPMIICHLIGRPDKKIAVLFSRNYSAPQILASAPLPGLDEENTLSVSHENGMLSLSVDRHRILKVSALQLFGSGSLTVAVRAELQGGTISSLEVSRLAPPENATALLAGDTLLEEHLYEQAIRRYLQVDDNRPGSQLAEKALQKAYQATFKLDSAAMRNEYALNIKKRLAAGYPDFNMAKLLTADACMAWRGRDYEMACTLMKKALDADPQSPVVQHVLAMPHEPLPEEIRNELTALIRRSQGITSLDLSGFGFTSLRGISDLRLTSLNCSGNQLTTLNELKKMPLVSLDCSRNQIRSVIPLRDRPLRFLDCSDNRIRDFGPLNKLRLLRKDLSGNPGRPARRAPGAEPKKP